MVNPKVSGAAPGTTQPHASALPPLRVSALPPILASSARVPTPVSSAKAPATFSGAAEPIVAPNKREPSLLILSRQIMNAVHRPMRGAGLKPPSPPPRSDRKLSYAEEQKRRAVDATNYNVQTPSVYPPPLPAKTSADGASATSDAASWEAEVESFKNGKGRALALFVVGAAIVCSALVVYFR